MEIVMQHAFYCGWPKAEVITGGFTGSEREGAKAAGGVTDWLRGLGY